MLMVPIAHRSGNRGVESFEPWAQHHQDSSEKGCWMISPHDGSSTRKIAALEELQARPQWVCWRRETRRGKTTKVPYNPRTGARAHADDPQTWGSYAQARAAWDRHPTRYDGIGYVFQGDYTGIDLDHCVHEDSTIDPWAQAYLDRLQSYAEYSPGDGIHVLALGTVPQGIRRKVPGAPHPEAAIELYCERRYFTITGRHIEGTALKLEDRQEVVTALYRELTAPTCRQQRGPVPVPLSDGIPIPADDRVLLDLAMRAKNGDKFQTLYAGDPAGYHSPSEADAALCSLLAFWTGRDAARMDRLFRGSGLYREKWDRPTGESTYGRITIAHAIAACAETYDPQRVQGVLPELSGADGHGNGRRPHRGAVTGEQERPRIIIGKQSRVTRDETLAALSRAQGKHPSLFIQSSRLARLGTDELGHPIITHMGIAELKNAMTDAADYYKTRAIPQRDEVRLLDAPTPKDIAELILGLPPQQWPFPPLLAVVETPVLRPDGSILDMPGYDASTRLYYAPQQHMQACKVPASPTRQEVDAALALIWYTIGEFPYSSQADQANALALLMTPLLRPAIRQHIPLALLDAPKQGTGKGLYSNVVSLIATGGTAAILTAPERDEEWDKRITALLMQGRTIITIDNLPGKLQSSKLDAVLTSEVYEGRILGQSTMVKTANRATWIATGNNIKLGGDLARRCYRIRLDPHVSRPWMRNDFTIKDLLTFVSDQRPHLIAALLTLARAWFTAGQPMDKDVPQLGSFTHWAQTIGGILTLCGVPGFLTNLEELYQEVDEDGTQMEAWLTAWYLHPKLGAKQWTTTPELIERINAGLAESARDSADSSFAHTLPEFLHIAFKEKPASFAIKLGRALEKRVDTCYGSENLRIERGKDSHTKGKMWRVSRGFADSADSSCPLDCIAQKQQDEEKNTKGEESDEHSPHYPQAPSPAPERNGLQSGASPISESVETAHQLSANVDPPEIPPGTLHECCTVWERSKGKGEHHGTTTRRGPGDSYWCEQCEPQYQLMALSHAGRYQGVVATLPDGQAFRVKPGEQAMLTFCQEAGYEMVKAALAALEAQR
jgi:hypothetical protein